MAATVSAWTKPGAWALDSEENESELVQEHKQDYVNDNSSGGGDTADFPSLAAAASTKTKKKKPQTLSLQEFATYKPSQPILAKGLTADEMMTLPTGPTQRSPEELDRNKLGGGFKSYGSYNERSSRYEQQRRQGSSNRDSNGEFGTSRDETDNWAAGKKSTVGNGFERRERGERGGFFSGSQFRADESDNWGSNKAFVPSEPRRYDRRGGFGLESNNGGADTDNWVKRKEDCPKNGGAFDSLRERRGSVESTGGDSEAWGRKIEDGSGGIGGRPRLNLQPRTLPVGEGPKGENTVKSKGNNPFGEARPREEVLKEKGQDWKEIDEKLETTKIKEVGTESPDGQAVGKRSFRRQPEERTWKKPESADYRLHSAEGTENEAAEETENGSAEDSDMMLPLQ
ncbi:eukaryotic translation initiation factor 4B3-like [Olea europaea var. sylvestris]|uniref:eukaryotic translation initiation factor 4B3-like n=1 Tax=Olea europaea var. sylvestris TaxID=158386 RepID=UPI000C1D4B90|nr:eukaryotic translation initiation factor 4B3-like [Olea europaea var. sylvestris]